MEDIETDCQVFDNHRRLPNRSSVMPDKSAALNSYDEQVDSGLGSLAYYSGEIDSLPVSEPENSERTSSSNKDISTSGHLGSLDIALSQLNIVGGQSSAERCDSGLDEGIEGESLDLDCNRASEIRISPNVNVLSREQVVEIFRADEDGDNHLHLSIIHNLPELTMQIIGLAPHWDFLSETNNLLQTPLHIAVLTNQVAVARRLVCAGAVVDVRDQFGNTPLHSACGLGYEGMVRALTTPVKRDETYQNKFYTIPFQRVPQDLEIRNYEGLTCFHLAAIGGHFEIMRLLLKAGADINAGEGKSGRTALHLAADWGNLAMTKYLLSHKTIKIEAVTYSGLTAVLLAYGRQKLDIVNELYKHGATMDPATFSDDLDADSSDEEMMQDVANGSLHNAQRRQCMACS